MKKLFFYIGTILCVIGMAICCIWALFSYINYLVKDTPFNWNSLYACCVFVLGYMLFAILSFLIDMSAPEDKPKKTRFQHRVEALREQEEKKKLDRKNRTS